MKNQILIVVATLVLSGCRLCGEEMKSEVKSPDGKYVAVVFERNCGATTSYVTHVNLRQSSHQFHKESSGTIIDGGVYTVEGTPEIKLVWIDELSLSIETTGHYEMFHKAASWNDIKISYK